MTPILEEIVGYLNFSSGVSDPKFLRNINSLFRVFSQKSSTTDSLTKFAEYVGQTTARLRAEGGPFADTTQAEAVLRILIDELLPTYREFHRDLLFHQEPQDLWQPFFLGRALEAVLSKGSPWNESERIVHGALEQLNDFVGYRPVATLESGAFGSVSP